MRSWPWPPEAEIRRDVNEGPQQTTWSVTQTRFERQRNDNRAALNERVEGVKRKVYLTKTLSLIFTAHFVADEPFQAVTNIPQVASRRKAAEFLSSALLSLLPKHAQINLKHFPQSSIKKRTKIVYHILHMLAVLQNQNLCC